MDPFIDMNEMVDYIFTELLLEGRIVTEEDIHLVLELQLEYLLNVGAAVILEDVESDE